MKAPCAQPATSILLRTKPPCAQSATPPRVASRAGCPASQHRASARLADGGAHHRPKGTEFPRKPCLWADNAPAEAATPPASIASRPISLRPPAEMFHVKHLYGTRVSLSQHAPCMRCPLQCTKIRDVRRSKDQKALFRPCCRRSFPRSSKHYNLDQAFSKTNETVRKVVSSKTSHTVPFCAKAPSFMRQPGSGPFHVAECIRGASCVSRETSVRFCHQTICSSDVDLR